MKNCKNFPTKNVRRITNVRSLLSTGYGLHNRGAPDPGNPRSAAGQGQDSGGAGPDVQAVHRPVRGPPQQIHLPYGTTGKSGFTSVVALAYANWLMDGTAEDI